MVGGLRGRGRPAYGLDRVPEAIHADPRPRANRLHRNRFRAYRRPDERRRHRPWTDLTADVAALSQALSRLATGGDPAPVVATRIARHLDARLALASALPPDSEVMVLLDRGLGRRRSPPCRVSGAPVAVASRPHRPGPDTCAGHAEVVTAAGPRLAHADAEGGRGRPRLGWGGDGAHHRDVAPPSPPPASFTSPLTRPCAGTTFNRSSTSTTVLALTEVVDRTRRRADAAGGIRLLYRRLLLASAPTDTALVGAIPTLTVSGIDTVIAASVPLPDAHGPWIARTVHEAVCRGLTPRPASPPPVLTRPTPPRESPGQPSPVSGRTPPSRDPQGPPRARGVPRPRRGTGRIGTRTDVTIRRRIVGP